MSLVPTAKNGLDRLLRLFIIAYQRRTQEPTRGARRTEARALGHGRYKHVINVSIERAFSSRFQFCKSASYRSICVRVQSPRSVPAWKARYHSTTQSGVCFKGSTGRQPRKAPPLEAFSLRKWASGGCNPASRIHEAPFPQDRVNSSAIQDTGLASISPGPKFQPEAKREASSASRSASMRYPCRG
jgi:hypothetical protein